MLAGGAVADLTQVWGPVPDRSLLTITFTNAAMTAAVKVDVDDESFTDVVDFVQRQGGDQSVVVAVSSVRDGSAAFEAAERLRCELAAAGVPVTGAFYTHTTQGAAALLDLDTGDTALASGLGAANKEG